MSQRAGWTARKLTRRAGAAVALCLLLTGGRGVNAASTGTTNLAMHQGSGSVTSQGDYIASSGGLNTFYSYFIEVTPGLTRLDVDLFDADVGLGGAGEAAAGRDRARGAFNTSARYTLIDPAGVTQATLTGNAAGPAGSDNAWMGLFTSQVPTFRSAASAVVQTTTSITVSKPTGTVQDDLMILLINRDGGSAGLTPPAGWTQIEQNDCGAAGPGGPCRVGVWYRVAGASEPASYSLSWTGNQDAVAGILTYSGVDTTNPIHQFAVNGGTSATPTAPSVTTTIANTRIVRLYGADDNISANPYPAGHTGRFNLQAFGDPVAGAADRQQVAAGATGTAAFALSASQEWRAVTLALTPAATPPAPLAGHWELRVDMSSAVTGGDDINALGVRAHDGDASSGGTELNVYRDSYAEYGVNSESASRTYTDYPYITSGCAADSNTFDWDEGSGGADTGSLAYSSRTGSFSQAVGTLAVNDSWLNSVVTGWTSNDLATDYGIWTETVNISGYPGNANYGVVYLGNDQAANPPPTAQPQANTFRIYLPTDAGAAPVKPYLEQLLTHTGGGAGNNGPNPPVVGQTSIFTVTVRLVNPTAFPITFSATNLVRANVPGGVVTYDGGAQVSQGSITSEPALGGSGDVTWNPGTVAAGATVLLSYRVRVTPVAAGTINVTATPASGNGTRATFVDETGNTTQARATYTLGALCQLMATTAQVTPALVSGLRLRRGAGGAVVEWETNSEVDVAGFELYRWDASRGEYQKVNRGLVTALLEAPQGGRYRLPDPGAQGPQTYVLAELDGKGGVRYHGPVRLSPDPDAPRLGSVSGHERRARRPRPDTPPAPERTRQRRARGSGDAPAGALKIGVRESGLYFVDASAIAETLGLSLARTVRLLNEGRFALSHFGRPVPWLRSSWGPGLLFYGERLDSLYSLDNVYWLRAGGGALMQTARGPRVNPDATDQTFGDTRHAEQDRLAATVVARDPDTDYWYWDYVSAGDATQGRKGFGLDAPGLDTGGAAVLRVDLQGATDSGIASEHRARVLVNGVALGETSWQGTTAHSAEFPVDPSLLVEQGNQVEVEGVLGGGVPYSIFYVDGFDLGYRRRYEAEREALFFRGDENDAVTVFGFADPRLLVLDLSDPFWPRLAKTRVAGEAGSYRVGVVPATPDTPYLAVSAGGVRTPAFVRADRPSQLRSRRTGAEYVVVTPRELAGAAHGLARLRQAQGLQTLVVDVEDVMDEFAWGVFDPRAIRAFLTHAWGVWSPRPQYVVLAGAGHFDYRDNLGLGGNLMPPLMVGTGFGLFASDGRFGDVSGEDGVPELAVGRVPVKTEAELQGYVDKLAAYDAASNGPWTGDALLLADDAQDGADFPLDSEAVAGSLSQYALERIYLTGGAVDVERAALLARLGSGVAVLNYLGHGGLDRLAAEGVLVTGDVAGLANGERLPLLTALTCIVNRFEVPGFTPLGAELVKKAGGGAAAVWAPTGLSQHPEALELGRRFYRLLEAEPGERVGELVRRALDEQASQHGPEGSHNVYNLLGDPALRLKQPAPQPPAGGGTGVPE